VTTETKTSIPGTSTADGLARRVPVQKRSRERYEKILDVALDVLSEKGSDAFKMSDIVERTGVSFGSLYQYFADKTAIIGTLAERHNEIGHDCVKTELSTIEKPQDLQPALCRLVDSYYQFFNDVPVMIDIWNATQSDRVLQELDQQDMKILSGFLWDALIRLYPKDDKKSLQLTSGMIMHLIAATVRHAITLNPSDAEKTVQIFKNMLPVDVKTLVADS